MIKLFCFRNFSVTFMCFNLYICMQYKFLEIGKMLKAPEIESSPLVFA